MIKAKVICQSKSPRGVVLTTFVLTYPRFMHSEFMTHRMFSRNASSSRAIPTAKQIQAVQDNPAVPLSFLKNKPGMQGGEALADQELAIRTWLEARDEAVLKAKTFLELGVHKQYANRIIEPWAHITVICSATDWDNFFALRIHPAALPEITALAEQMYTAYSESIPKEVGYGEWHLPFIGPADLDRPLRIQIQQSAARCARVSYLNHDGTTPTLEQDIELHDRLVGAIPMHASPMEHQATPLHSDTRYSANFRGWLQYRKTLANENITKYTGTGHV